MLQHKEADDFVLATGEQHSVREFCEKTFAKLGMPIEWEGKDVDEVAKAKDGDKKGQVLIRVDPQYFRPTEVETLLGDATKAKEKLGWVPTTSFEALVDDMIEYEEKALASGEDNWA